MSFRDPSQREHLRAGRLAALKSPKTPKHLKPHLARLTQARLSSKTEGATTMSPKPPSPQGSRRFRPPVPPRSQDPNNVSPRNGVPLNQVFSPGTDQFENPGDQESFTSGNNDTTPMGTKVKASTKQPAPAGTRPMNVQATLPPRKGPGIVKTQTARTASPKAPGLAQNLPRVANPKPKAKGLNQTVAPRLPQRRGVAQTISMQKTRNMRPGSANPAFYGDFGV